LQEPEVQPEQLEPELEVVRFSTPLMPKTECLRSIFCDEHETQLIVELELKTSFSNSWEQSLQRNSKTGTVEPPAEDATSA
jgi:hypothetical protein